MTTNKYTYNQLVSLAKKIDQIEDILDSMREERKILNMHLGQQGRQLSNS